MTTRILILAWVAAGLFAIATRRVVQRNVTGSTAAAQEVSSGASGWLMNWFCRKDF
jgi:hypothetical protein